MTDSALQTHRCAPHPEAEVADDPVLGHTGEIDVSHVRTAAPRSARVQEQVIERGEPHYDAVATPDPASSDFKDARTAARTNSLKRVPSVLVVGTERRAEGHPERRRRRPDSREEPEVVLRASVCLCAPAADCDGREQYDKTEPCSPRSSSVVCEEAGHVSPFPPYSDRVT